VKLAAFILTAALLSTTAGAATITVTITGTTGEIRVGEGPIFGHRSYTLIPPGGPFSLTYTFDEEKGKQTISELSNGLISQSEIENTKLSSPGASATLQIGRAVTIAVAGVDIDGQWLCYATNPDGKGWTHSKRTDSARCFEPLDLRRVPNRTLFKIIEFGASIAAEYCRDEL
jgi:hypothetical protein